MPHPSDVWSGGETKAEVDSKLLMSDNPHVGYCSFLYYKQTCFHPQYLSEVISYIFNHDSNKFRRNLMNADNCVLSQFKLIMQEMPVETALCKY